MTEDNADDEDDAATVSSSSDDDAPSRVTDAAVGEKRSRTSTLGAWALQLVNRRVRALQPYPGLQLPHGGAFGLTTTTAHKIRNLFMVLPYEVRGAFPGVGNVEELFVGESPCHPSVV